MTDTLTILRHARNPMAKQWLADGSIGQYGDGKFFKHTGYEAEDLGALAGMLKWLATEPTSCVIRGKYVDGADPGSAATEYAGDKDLPGAYEQSVLAADDVGDRLRQDAQRVQERASLETQIQARHELLSGLDGKLGDLASGQVDQMIDAGGVLRERHGGSP